MDPATIRQNARNLMAVGRNEQARELVGELMARDPGDGYTVRLLGEVESRLGNLDEALDAARRAVGLLSDGYSHMVLASIHHRRGEFVDAAEVSRAGLQIAPDDASLHVALSLACSGRWVDEPKGEPRSEREADVETARMAASTALELDPDWTQSHWAAAAAELAGGDPFAAARALERGLALRPDWSGGHLMMSTIRARQGMLKLSSQHLVEAGRNDPSDERPLNTLRRMRGPRTRFGRRVKAPWWFTGEAREVLEADDSVSDV